MAKLSGLLEKLPPADPKDVAAMPIMRTHKPSMPPTASTHAEQPILAASSPPVQANWELVNEQHLRLADIDVSPYQPRIRFDPEAIRALADTISEGGLINAIIVRRKANGRYELIAGERRYRAHELLNKETILAKVKVMSDEEAALKSLIDNVAREDLCDFEQGKSYHRLIHIDKLVKDQAKLSRMIGVPASTISRCLMYFKLPPEALAMLEESPAMLGGTSAAKLSMFAVAGHNEIVVKAMKKIRDNMIPEQTAVDWATGEVRKLEKAPTPPPIKAQVVLGGIHLGDYKVDGNKVVFTCHSGIKPEQLIAALLAQA